MTWKYLLATCGAAAACSDPPGAATMAQSQAVRLAAGAGIVEADMPELADIAEMPTPGGTVVHLAQVIDGLPVYQRELRMLVRDDGTLVTSTGTIYSRRTRRSTARFVDDEPTAILRAAAGRTVERARARKVWWPQGDELVAAWVVEAYVQPRSELRRIVLAADGRILADDSLVADVAFSYRVFAETTGEKHPFDAPVVDATPHPSGTPDKSFPAYVAPNLVTIESLPGHDPWLPANTNQTSGNNVDAYVDLNPPNGLGSGDFRATAIGMSFDRTYDTSQGPLASQNQQMAAVTSLFYVTNWLHDFWYDAGFTETAGNAQKLNYGRGGVEDDVLLAEAQDNALGGSRNNANMSTPDDGMSPRMQVYLWSGRDTRTMTISPSGRTPEIGGAVYGPKDFTVTGSVVLGTDTGASTADGCMPIVNNVTGKIVVVNRGNCTFKTKTFNVQNAGGIAVVIVDNVAATAPPGLGDDSALPDMPTIPSVSVTQAEGTALATDLINGPVSATIHRAVAPELDGALDSTLIAHEFGHYLHHRLAFCGNAMCRALSEGWGDFSALMLMARPGDDLTGTYPFSVYVTQSYAGDPGYFGIRRAPYSVDMNKNALSFRHMADREPLPSNHPIQPSNDNSESHNAGEVWAEALWETYVALQQQGASHGSSFEEVRAKMARYVVAGLAMTPFEASPMEARDGILAAALAYSREDHQTMIEAFARRGFGSCAVAPEKTSVDFVGLVESKVIAGNPGLELTSLSDSCDEDGILDTGETARVHARVANHGHAALTDVTFTLTSQIAGVAVQSEPVHLDTLDTFAMIDLDFDVALTTGLREAIAGDLELHVTASGGCEQSMDLPIASRLNVDDVPASSATDSFDTAGSPWSPWAASWSHMRRTPLDGFWHGIDLPTVSDVSLTSPFLVASTKEPLVIEFEHSFSFELSDSTAYDGGVVELSIDNGVTWVDVSTLAQAGYTGSVDSKAANVLADRLAYVGTNPSWPAADTVTLELGMALAGQTFQVRFRIGTDGGTGAYGWDVDNVAFSGIEGKPFPAELPDDASCDPTAVVDPIVSGGGGCCDSGAPSNNVFAVFVLPLLVRRRRMRPQLAHG